MNIIPDLNETSIFLDKLNSQTNLKFTMEVADQIATPFVGMNIANSGEKFEISVYRKFTNTG